MFDNLSYQPIGSYILRVSTLGEDAVKDTLGEDSFPSLPVDRKLILIKFYYHLGIELSIKWLCLL